MFKLRVILLKNSFIIPFLQLIRTLDVAKKGRPRITGIWDLELCTLSMVNITKSIGKMNSPHFDKHILYHTSS